MSKRVENKVGNGEIARFHKTCTTDMKIPGLVWERVNSWLVVLGFNATLTAKVIWQSVTHMCFLAFSHQYKHNILSKAINFFSSCLSRGERQKYARKKVRLNRVSNSQPPGHELMHL